eukprot:1324809-Amphidinium_carterae.1
MTKERPVLNLCNRETQAQKGPLTEQWVESCRDAWSCDTTWRPCVIAHRTSNKVILDLICTLTIQRLLCGVIQQCGDLEHAGSVEVQPLVDSCSGVKFKAVPRQK